PPAALLGLHFLVGPDYFRFCGAGTSFACAAPLASSTEATSQPSALVFSCNPLLTVSGSDAVPPPAATVTTLPSGFRAPLETAGLNGSNNADPVVSTIPPGTFENAFTEYL